MPSRLLLLLLSSIGLYSTAISSSPTSQENKVLATKLESLTLHNGRMTTGRRTSPVPQLKCIGGSAMGLHNVETMRCRAQGSAYDTTDIQWTCTADTGPLFKLGSTQVMCEGYDHADDPYILKGSCGVEYRLILTEEGEAKFPHRPSTPKREKPGFPALLFGLLFVAVAFMILRGIFKAWQENRRYPGRALQGTTAYGPNDDDDNDDGDDPPPPYSEDGTDSPAWPPTGKFSKSAQGSSSDVNQAGPSSSRYNSQLGTAAMAAGAGAAAALAASQVYRSSTRARQEEETRRASNARTRPSRTWDREDSYGSSSQSQESIGFGGTTRR